MAPIISIDNCSASQLIKGETIKIAGGKLSLETVNDPAVNASLVLRIGESFVLPIETDSEVGTKGDRSYLFIKTLPPSDEPVKATTAIEADMDEVAISPSEQKADKINDTRLIVQVDMPESASEADLTTFEKTLVDHKFLMVGVQADADNLSKTILEWAGQKTQSLKAYTRSNSLTPATSPTQFDTNTHSVAQSLSSGTAILADTATKLGTSINAGIESFGGFIGSKIGTRGIFSASEKTDSQGVAQTKEAIKDGFEAVGTVGEGIKQGATDLASATGDAAVAASHHNYGEDAAKLTEHAKSTAASLGSVGATALQQTSVALHGAQLGKGAVKD